MIDRGRTRLWLLAAGLLALSMFAALLARAQGDSDPASASPGAAPGLDAAEVDARLEDLLTRAEERLQESSPDAAALGAEVTALRRELATARAQIEILKGAVVESVVAHSTTDAELRRLKGEPSTAPGASGGPDAPATAALSRAEGPGEAAPAAGRSRSLRSDAGDAPASAADAEAGPLLLTEIHFNPGRAELTPGGRRETVEVVERLDALPEGKLRVVGYTDTVGGADYNKHLALRRADSVAGLLAELGVPDERIEIVGAGEEALPEPTSDEVAEPLNRCAGIILLTDAPAGGAAPQRSGAIPDADARETQMAALQPEAGVTQAAPVAEAVPDAFAATVAQIGRVTIHDPWASAVVGGGGSSAVYMTLGIEGDETDRLVDAATPVAERAELHAHVMDEGIARTRRVSALELAPDAPTVLQPQGMYLRLVNLKEGLAEGDTLPLTVTFEKAGSAQIEVPVLGLAAGLQRATAHGAHHGEAAAR